MSSQARPRAYLIFTGTGPILVLSTYPELTDPRLVANERLQVEFDRPIAERVIARRPCLSLDARPGCDPDV